MPPWVRCITVPRPASRHRRASFSCDADNRGRRVGVQGPCNGVAPGRRWDTAMSTTDARSGDQYRRTRLISDYDHVSNSSGGDVGSRLAGDVVGAATGGAEGVVRAGGDALSAVGHEVGGTAGEAISAVGDVARGGAAGVGHAAGD